MRPVLRFFTIACISGCALMLSQCSSYDFSRRIVQQGNLLPQHKIDRLRIGMSKKEAAILMGTTMISPMFNNNRWDYVYTWRKGSGRIDKRTLILYFKNGQLAKIDKNLSGTIHNTI